MVLVFVGGGINTTRPRLTSMSRGVCYSIVSCRQHPRSHIVVEHVNRARQAFVTQPTSMHKAIAMSELPVRHNPLFAALPTDELEHLLASLSRRSLPSDTLLFHEGAYGDRCYIVLTGEVEIVQALGRSDERLIAVRGPGALIGEMSLLHPERVRVASGRTRTPTELLELTRTDFDALLTRQPALAFEMVQLLSQRLRESHDVTTRDLGHQLAQAYADLQRAQAALLEREQLARDLELAHEIQQRMLPQTLPQLPGWSFGAQMVPARHVGGDFFDLIRLSADVVGVVVADVCGKGMGAALHMALTRGLLRAELSRPVPPLEALQQVNHHLLDVSDAGLFVTVGYAIVQRGVNTVTYYRAGHELPIVVAPGGETSVPVRGPGHPLGLIVEPAIDTQMLTISAGGALLLYTDGVTEAENVDGRFFGSERLRQAVQNLAQSDPQQCCDELIQQVLAFQDGVSQSDDLTVISIQMQ